MTHFGGYLARLLTHRGIRPDELPGITELPAVLAGAAPTVAQLDLLAPALGFHAADLYLMAGLPEPSVYRREGGERWRLVPAARVLSPERLARVVELADGLPREPVEPPPGPVPRFDPRAGGFGAVLVNLLWCGRNMRPRDIQWALVTLTGVGLSQPTIPGVAQRPDSLTPETAAGLGSGPGPGRPAQRRGASVVRAVRARGDQGEERADVSGRIPRPPAVPCVGGVAECPGSFGIVRGTRGSGRGLGRLVGAGSGPGARGGTVWGWGGGIGRLPSQGVASCAGSVDGCPQRRRRSWHVRVLGRQGVR